jgi:hypothetical protein
MTKISRFDLQQSTKKMGSFAHRQRIERLREIHAGAAR